MGTVPNIAINYLLFKLKNKWTLYLQQNQICLGVNNQEAIGDNCYESIIKVLK